MAESSFAELVHGVLGSLLEQHGLGMSEREQGMAAFESERLLVRVTFDPRGEVDLTVARRSEPTTGVFHDCRLVGRAPVERLLELARQALVADPRILAGNEEYFAELAATQAKSSVEWTAYHEGTGPRPRSRGLP